MAIRLRRGNLADFDKNKLVAGELGLILDAGELNFCYSAGNTKKLQTAEDLQAMLDVSGTAYSALQALIADLELNPSELTNILNNITALQTNKADKSVVDGHTAWLGEIDSELIQHTSQLADIPNQTYITNKATRGDGWINIKYPPIPLIGAIGDGISDDTTAINNIISTIGKGIFYFPDGDYLLNGNVTWGNSNIILQGSGRSTRIFGSTATLLSANGSNGADQKFIIRDMQIEATGNNLCLDFERTFTAAPRPSLLLENVWFKGTVGTLVKLTNVRESYVSKCVFEGGGVEEGTAQMIWVDTINCSISDCVFYRGNTANPGGRGLLLDDTLGVSPHEGVKIINSIFIDLETGIEANDILDIDISHCMIDQIDNPVIIKNTNNIRFIANYVGRRLTDGIGLYIVNDTKTTSNALISLNNITSNDSTGYGIKCEALSTFYFNHCDISDNQIINYDISGIDFTRVSNSKITNNYIEGTVRSIIENAGCNANIIQSNIVTNGITVLNAVTIDNRGFKTKNYGSATILSGATSVTVTHGLALTPTIVMVTPNGSQAIGKQFYIVNKTTTTFQIVVNAAVASDLPFDWFAERNTII